MKTKYKLAHIFPILIFVFIFCGLIIRNLKLSSLPFYDWDESLYAQIAAEILKNHSLVTTFNGHLWFDKPPLLHALIAGIFTVFGLSEFWTRSLTIVFAMALLVLIYFLAKQLLENLFKDQINKMDWMIRQIAYLVPVLIIASSSLFIEKSLLLNTDIIIAVSWVGYFLFRENFILKSLFLLLGVFSKSVFGFYPLLFEFLAIRKSAFRQKNIFPFVSLIFLSSLWYLFSYIAFGNYFIKAHFLDQVLKRIVVPIELHFGGKFYYFEFLWSNLGIILGLLVIGYIFLFMDTWKLFIKERLAIFKSKRWWFYLVLLSPFPFLIFITLIKTKLYWYLTMIIPLLALSASYLFIKIQKNTIRAIVSIFIFSYFLFSFIPQTYSLKQSVSIPNKVALAKCLSEKPGKTIAFLTDPQERKNQNFLEAAHYDTTASFYYGGSPSFVFYSRKKIEFFYNVAKFVKDYSKYDIVVLSRESATKDLEVKNDQVLQKKIKKSNNYCQTNEWLAFPK